MDDCTSRMAGVVIPFGSLLGSLYFAVVGVVILFEGTLPPSGKGRGAVAEMVGVKEARCLWSWSAMC